MRRLVDLFRQASGSRSRVISSAEILVNNCFKQQKLKLVKKYFKFFFVLTVYFGNFRFSEE